MFDFKCLFCNEVMPLATSKGYHKVCARALREVEVPAFSLDKAWINEVSEDIEEDNTTLDLGPESTFDMGADTTDPLSEDSWEGKTEIIRFEPRVLADIA